MKNYYLICCLGILLSSLQSVYAEEGTETVRIISYNLENLFDCEDDPNTNDESFTPEGDHQWTPAKYWVKLNNLSRAITAAGEWYTPILIGLCEVENAKVVNDLLNHTQLRECGYQFIHKDSPDQRGVDVALVYLPTRYTPIQEDFIPVHIEDGKPTRDILHSIGLLDEKDTLHIFVNHWPSRYGGEIESESKRVTAATTLREKTDQILDKNPHSKIIIMGDFNDYPNNESIINGLCAVAPKKNCTFDQLYNLAYPIHEKGIYGSHKFGGEWGMLDQFIVSGELLSQESSLFVQQSTMHICQESFLLKESATGPAPRRSFLGTFFAYGYSDHLPVYIDLLVNK